MSTVPPASASTTSSSTSAAGAEVVVVHSFVLPELSAFATTSREFAPIRVQLCHNLLLTSSSPSSYHAFPSSSSSAEGQGKLASVTDLGQFHTDAYLATLAHFTQYFPSSSSKRQRQVDQTYMSNKLRHFNLAQPSDDVLEYARLVATGTLQCCDRLLAQHTTVAANLYGGQSQAQRQQAHNGSVVNDSVLACLYLVNHHPTAAEGGGGGRVLFVSTDLQQHGFALEEAFYCTDRVITLSLHTQQQDGGGTGKEEDQGAGPLGTNTKFNCPLLQGGEGEEDVAGVVEQLLPALVSKFAPHTIVFVPGGGGGGEEEEEEVIQRVCQCVRRTKLPVLVLGGTSEDELVAASKYASVLRALSAAAAVPPVEEVVEVVVEEEQQATTAKAPTTEEVPPPTNGQEEKKKKMSAHAGEVTARLLARLQ